MFVITNILLAIVLILNTLLTIYSFVIVASALISWVNPDPYNPIVRTLRMLTEPVYKPIRKKIKLKAPIDIAPILLLLAIMFIQNGILPSVQQFALMLGK